MTHKPNTEPVQLSFDDKTRSLVEALCTVADRHNVPCFLVGGTVRDALLGARRVDIDVLIDSGNRSGITAERFSQLASAALGGSRPVCFDRYGTYHFVVGRRSRSVAKVEVVGADLAVSEDYQIRNPAEVFRRDFTVNSLLVGINKENFGRFYDLTGRGLEDLKLRVLTCPKDPDETLRADPIRMLRAVRLACTLNFSIGESVAVWIQQHAEMVNKAAVERIRSELELMLLSDKPSKAIEMLRTLALLDRILPEIAALQGVTQDKRFHNQDVYSHALAVLDNIRQKDIVLRLAALFHDVGKKETKTLKGERVVFYGHERLGASIVARRLYSLRFSKKVTQQVCALVRNHMINYSDEWTDAAIRRLIRRLGPLLPKQLDLYEADIMALCDSDQLLQAARSLRARIENIDRKEQVAKIKPPLNGHEICKLLNIEPGPLVGRLKTQLLDAVITGQIENTKEAATEFLHRLYSDRR